MKTIRMSKTFILVTMITMLLWHLSHCLLIILDQGHLSHGVLRPFGWCEACWLAWPANPWSIWCWHWSFLPGGWQGWQHQFPTWQHEGGIWAFEKQTANHSQSLDWNIVVSVFLHVFILTLCANNLEGILQCFVCRFWQLWEKLTETLVPCSQEMCCEMKDSEKSHIKWGVQSVQKALLHVYTFFRSLVATDQECQMGLGHIWRMLTLCDSYSRVSLTASCLLRLSLSMWTTIQSFSYNHITVGIYAFKFHEMPLKQS